MVRTRYGARFERKIRVLASMPSARKLRIRTRFRTVVWKLARSVAMATSVSPCSSSTVGL